MTGEARFFSSLQTGLATALDAIADDTGLPPAIAATVEPALKLAEMDRVFSQSMPLLGPADVMRVDADAVKAAFPKPNDQDVAPNFFPYVELYDASLPWLFTPARPHGSGRLAPWMVLVVLPLSDDVRLQKTALVPGMTLSIARGAGAQLPPLDEAYAWAHVEDRSGLSDAEQAYATQPDSFVSRLMCPVRMAPNARYVAALVPTFEAGRQAGLGREVTQSGAVLSWSDDTEALDLPAYYHWTFTTGTEDFEALVRKLRGIPVSDTTGQHDLDISNPEGGLNIGTILGRRYAKKSLLVSYQGALLSPRAKPRSWPREHQTPFQEALKADLVPEQKAPTNRKNYDAATHDPVITAPLYGSFQKDRAAFATGKVKWMDTLNLDPQYRSNAGLGARTVRRHQERLMGKAWARAEAVQEVQTYLRQSRVALSVGTSVHGRLARLPAPQYIQMTTQIQPSVASKTDANLSVAQQVREIESIPNGVLSPTFRRSAALTQTRVKTIDPPVATQITLQSAVTVSSLSGVAATLTQRLPDLDAGSRTYVPYSFGTVTLNPSLSLQTLASQVGMTFTTASRVPSGPVLEVQPAGPIGRLDRLGQTAIVDRLLTDIAPVRQTVQVMAMRSQSVAGANPATLKSTIQAAVQPVKVLPPRVLNRVEGLKKPPTKQVEIPRTAKLTVRFEEPAYEFLQTKGAEFLLPGFGEVAEHSVSLLVTNSAFVESYLLGLNHEMSREFAWRQFPAALRDTWFHRFWDYLGEEPKNDITAIAKWPNNRGLGTGTSTNDAVVLVKSPLFRRYPDTLVYAVPAQWTSLEKLAADEAAELQRTGAIASNGMVRIADFSKPGRMLFPSFSGRIGTAAAFFGFATDPLSLVGTKTPQRGKGDAGYFVVFEQGPTEMTFGLDQATRFRPSRAPRAADDLSWGHFAASPDDLAQLTHATAAPDWANRAIEGARWGNTAAETAKLALQSPVRVMFHASGLVNMEGVGA